MPETVQVIGKLEAGGEAAIAAMDEYSYLEIGRKTYRFFRQIMRDPAMREQVKARTAQRLAAQAASATMEG